MQIKDPEPLLQHLEKTSRMAWDHAAWYISDKLTLWVDMRSEPCYCLRIDSNDDEELILWQDVGRMAALHWLRESQ